MYEKDYIDALDRVLDALSSTQCLFYQSYSQISVKKTNLGLGHQISLGNVTMYDKDMHPLLLECFLISLRSITIDRRVPDSISDHLMVITVSFLLNPLSNFQTTP